MSPGTVVVTLGEALATIASMEPGPWRPGSGMRLSFAGAEANVAIGLSRLGHPARLVGRLGCDPAGDMILRELVAENIDTRFIRRDPSAPTAALFREQRSSDRAVITYLRSHSAGSRLDASDVDESAIVDAGFLHLTGVTAALSHGSLAACHKAVELASASKVPISLDVNYRGRLWPRDRAAEVLGELARTADLVFGGPDELSMLSKTDTTPADVAQELIACGVREVVCKDGARGATTYGHSAGPSSVAGRVSSTSVPALTVTVVDTVGAGDAFVAGYLSAELDGLAITEKLDRAVRVGAVAVSTRGDWEGLPHRAELADLFEGDDVRR